KLILLMYTIPSTNQIYTLSLHDALPISVARWVPTSVPGLSSVAEIALGGVHTCARKTDGTLACWGQNGYGQLGDGTTLQRLSPTDRKSTRLNSSHVAISYAVFCLKKKMC